MNQPMIQHSGHGITAIVLGCLAICILLLNITLWLFFRVGNQLSDSNQMILALLVLINLGIIIFGLINSLKGIFQQGRKKILPVIGLALNSFVLLAYIIGIINWVTKKYF